MREYMSILKEMPKEKKKNNNKKRENFNHNNLNQIIFIL